MRADAPITAVMLACTGLAIAHQPYESSAVARFDAEALELVVTTSFEIAGHLVGHAIRQRSPASLTIDATQNYSFSGAGAKTGATSLTKSEIQLREEVGGR